MHNILSKIADHLLTNTDDLPITYLAGKVTNLPYEEVWTKFKVKQLELEADGYFVLNPLEHISQNENWQHAMRISVILLAVSKNICLLPDWHKSNGATLERNLAMPLGINFIES